MQVQQEQITKTNGKKQVPSIQSNIDGSSLALFPVNYRLRVRNSVSRQGSQKGVSRNKKIYHTVNSKGMFNNLDSRTMNDLTASWVIMWRDKPALVSFFSAHLFWTVNGVANHQQTLSVASSTLTSLIFLFFFISFHLSTHFQKHYNIKSFLIVF